MRETHAATHRRAKRAALAGAAIGMLALAACSTTDPAARPQAATLLAAVRAPTGAFAGTARVRLVQNAVRVEAIVGTESAPRTFLLDSGAPMTLAPRVARALDLGAQAETALLGPDGDHDDAPVVRIPEVRVAGHTFGDVGAVVGWPQQPSPLACLSRDGLLGASLLRAAIWQIDFHAGRLTVTDELASLPGLEFAMRIPFHRADAAGSPRIDVDLGDSRAASLLIDLGFNGSLAIPDDLFRRSGNHLPEAAPTERGDGAATVLGDGASVLHVARLRELRLGGLVLPDFPVLTGPGVSDFHLGVAFLRHFRVTLDWRHDQLYLQRRDPEHALYETYESFGFTPTLRDGALVVGGLWDDGAAARQGLRRGDRIVALDGRPTEEISFAAYCRLLDEVALYGSRRAPIDVTTRREGLATTLTVERTPLLPAAQATSARRQNSQITRDVRFAS